MSAAPGDATPDTTVCGAHWRGDGADFVVRSRTATSVQLCLFDQNGREDRRSMVGKQGCWSLFVEDVAPGQLYGYRVDGPYQPRVGQRCNPAKLLVDPWARAVHGALRWDASLHGYGERGPWRGPRSEADSALSVPRSVLVDPAFDWDDDRPPRTPWCESVLYEAHLRGLTRLHPDVPTQQRGTYLGLGHPAVVEHLQSLGVTAVQLLPLHHHESEQHLRRTGLDNYWGYSPLSWFAPHAGYASGSRGEQVHELKTMVRVLHAAGLEVILDVVYNHTIEGGPHGPTLSWRGFDDALYYRSQGGKSVDWTGCGNTVDLSQPEVLEMVLDSLRYWVREMHVDGFRFDLAPVLGRDAAGHFDAAAAFFSRVEADPDFAGVKLIAEPWDLGPDGYAFGRFPPRWLEWNDRFRDAARRYWCGDGSASELARRVVGSPELFPGPRSSVHYVTCHDGFTLRDLVSYERKHNLANGEHNRDGNNANWSCNWGVEGPTDDPEINALRHRAQRNLLATVLLSLGVPMLGHGDELGRTQHGNNNAYCQDNETSWVDWELGPQDAHLLEGVRSLLALRRRWQALFSAALSVGRAIDPPGGSPRPAAVHVTCFDAAGAALPLDQLAPDHGEACCLLLQLRSRQCYLLAYNRAERPRQLALPVTSSGSIWHLVLDTARMRPTIDPPESVQADRVAIDARSLLGMELHGDGRAGVPRC